MHFIIYTLFGILFLNCCACYVTMIGWFDIHTFEIVSHFLVVFLYIVNFNTFDRFQPYHSAFSGPIRIICCLLGFIFVSVSSSNKTSDSKNWEWSKYEKRTRFSNLIKQANTMTATKSDTKLQTAARIRSVQQRGNANEREPQHLLVIFMQKLYTSAY